MGEASRFTPNEKLRRERESHNWTQEELAEQIGTTAFNVSRWERGETNPGPHYRRKLCELFSKTSEELGFVKPRGAASNGARRANSINHEFISEAHAHAESAHRASTARRFHPSDTRKRKTIILIVILAFIIGAISAWAVLMTRTSSTSPRIHTSSPIKPGGSWISPKDGQTVHDLLHFAAYAYPTNSGDPTIDYVNFTMWWQGIDPRKWIVACAPHVSFSKDVYVCDVNLAKLGAPAGQIRISFDVYDKKGNKNLAPNGVHSVIYVPGHS